MTSPQDSTAPPRQTRRDQLCAEIAEWERLAAECTDARPKDRLDILRQLQAKRAELHAHDAAQRIRQLPVERAAQERSALALSAGSHVAAVASARQAEQERLAREERERQEREQALARETPASARTLLIERLRALPAGELRLILDGIGSACHLAPGTPCPVCDRPVGAEADTSPAPVAAVAPAAVAPRPAVPAVASPAPAGAAQPARAGLEPPVRPVAPISPPAAAHAPAVTAAPVPAAAPVAAVAPQAAPGAAPASSAARAPRRAVGAPPGPPDAPQAAPPPEPWRRR